MKEATLREHLVSIIDDMRTDLIGRHACIDTADLDWHMNELIEWQERWLKLYCKGCASCDAPCDRSQESE